MTGEQSVGKISPGKLQVKFTIGSTSFFLLLHAKHPANNKNLLISKGIRSFDFLATSSEPSLEKSFSVKNSFIQHHLQCPN
jgi:hypothetical protein